MISPQTFRQRFALANFSDGGVVVDTTTGSYCRLNTAAATICETMEASANTEEAVTRTARLLRISQATSSEYIGRILTDLDRGGDRATLSNPIQYSFSDEGGYDLSFEGERVLHVDAKGLRLELIADLDKLRFPVHAFIRHIVPKIAFIRGLTVLHGAAVASGPHAVAICGISGAGKTTTARLLSKYERELIAEDLIVVAPEENGTRIFKHGEQLLNEWSTSSAKRIESNPSVATDTDLLLTAGSGPTVELRSIWFMDAGHRIDGADLEKTPLPAAETLIRMLGNSFIGAASWRRHLESLRCLVATTEGYEVKVPNTLGRLEQALAHQTTNSAS